jgi:hypothetical protein
MLGRHTILGGGDLSGGDLGVNEVGDPGVVGVLRARGDPHHELFSAR